MLIVASLTTVTLGDELNQFFPIVKVPVVVEAGGRHMLFEGKQVRSAIHGKKPNTAYRNILRAGLLAEVATNTGVKQVIIMLDVKSPALNPFDREEPTFYISDPVQFGQGGFLGKWTDDEA